MKYSNMHDEMLDYLKHLSDEKYQDRVWVGSERPHPMVMVDDIMHFFYDDTSLGEDADRCIGWFLRDAREAVYIRAVIEAMDVVWQKYGTALKGSEYVAVPEWQHVLATAKAAFVVVSEPDLQRDAQQ